MREDIQMERLVLKAQGEGHSIMRDANIVREQKEKADINSVKRLYKYFNTDYVGCGNCIFNKPEVCEVVMRSGNIVKLCDLVTLIGGRDIYNGRIVNSSKKVSKPKRAPLKKGDKVVYTDISSPHLKEWCDEIVEGKIFLVVEDQIHENQTTILIQNDSVFGGNSLLEDIKYLKKVD